MRVAPRGNITDRFQVVARPLDREGGGMADLEQLLGDAERHLAAALRTVLLSTDSHQDDLFIE